MQLANIVAPPPQQDAPDNDTNPTIRMYLVVHSTYKYIRTHHGVLCLCCASSLSNTLLIFVHSMVSMPIQWYHLKILVHHFYM